MKSLGVPVSALGLSVVGYFDGGEAGSFKVGGLLFAMFLTLYFIPALFYVTNKDK